MEVPLKWHGSLCSYSTLLSLINLILGLGHEIKMGTFHGSPGYKVRASHTLDTHIVRSRRDCAAKCGQTDGCTSVSFEPATNVCITSFFFAAESRLYTDVDAGWETYSKNDWLLVFRAPKGIGGDPYSSYINGVDVTTTTVDCANLTTTACQSNYRHPILDNWGTANIAKVRFSFYKNQEEVAYVVFDASGETFTSWFAKERILDSTWPTSKTDSYATFSLDGYTTTGILYATRRFNIHLSHGGCPYDRLYTLAVTGDTEGCTFDIHPTYPQYLYASTTSPGNPEAWIGTDMADFMAIFVKT